jgi:hypothetical protein
MLELLQGLGPKGGLDDNSVTNRWFANRYRVNQYTLDLSQSMDASTITWMVIGAAVLAYHVYVGYLVDGAKCSGGVAVLAVILLTSIPLLGAAVVHVCILGATEGIEKAGNGPAPNDPEAK